MIVGTNVVLRPVRDADLEELFALENSLSNRGVLAAVGFQSFVEYKRDYEKFGWWFDDGGGLVITTRDGRLIGTIGCRRNGIVAGYEVGYQIFREEDRRQGYMGEALQLFSDYMFDWKDIPRLYLFIDPENVASVALAQKTGYSYEGLMRRALFACGAYRDLVVYAIVRAQTTV